MVWRMRKRRNRNKLVPRRVLHLSSAHPWTDNRIHWREAVSLASAGYDVGVHAVATSNDTYTPVQVSEATKMPRFKRMSFGSLQALRVALSTNAKIIHIHDPELIWIIPFLKAGGRKVIYDAHEDLPAQVMDKPYLPSPIRKSISWAAKGLVIFAGASSSWVIAATETIASRFDKEKTTIVRNYPHSLNEDTQTVSVEKRASFAVYVGGISQNRGGDVMVKAFASSNIPSHWHLLMAGQVSPGYLEELQQNPGWGKVKYCGKVSPSKARSIIRQSRVGIVTLKNTVAYRDSLPTKMFEYMAEGVAVIASDFPLWRSIIERYDCGLLVDETSPEAIAAAIARYAENEELLRRHSRNGIRAAKEIFTWENEAQNLLAAYEAVLDS